MIHNLYVAYIQYVSDFRTGTCKRVQWFTSVFPLCSSTPSVPHTARLLSCSPCVWAQFSLYPVITTGVTGHQRTTKQSANFPLWSTDTWCAHVLLQRRGPSLQRWMCLFTWNRKTANAATICREKKVIHQHIQFSDHHPEMKSFFYGFVFLKVADGAKSIPVKGFKRDHIL